MQVTPLPDREVDDLEKKKFKVNLLVEITVQKEFSLCSTSSRPVGGILRLSHIG